MKRKYVILSTTTPPRPRVRGARGAGTLSFSPPPSPKIDVDRLDPQIAADIAAKKSVLAMCPVLPIKLVAPVSVDNATPADAGDVTWGVNAIGADTSPFDGQGIVAAVLDTGIDPSHPAFNGVELVRENFTDEGEDDQDGHGTHCAGTIFGRNVDGTRIGVAPGIQKAVIGKILGAGGGASDKIARAIEWAISKGANVISMSLGIDFPGYVKDLESNGFPTELATSIALEDYRLNVRLFEKFAAYLGAQNPFSGQATILIAAAGNESRRQINPDFEIAVSPPAVAEGFVSVAGVAKSPEGFTIAPFSNVGARVSGPGVDVRSAKPGGGLVSMNGTSMATPHVAGVAALWAQKLSMEGGLNGQLLSERLIGTATTVGLKPGFAPRDIGAGLVRAPQN